MQRRGDVLAAKHYFEEALLLCEHEKDEVGAITQLNHLGAVQFASAQFDDAERSTTPHDVKRTVCCA